MRKCIAHAIIKNRRILSLDFMPIRGRELNRYISWNDGQEKLSRKYKSIHDIITEILNIMHANNLYCGHVHEFGGKFYDIYIMNLDVKEKYFSRYLYKE